jgi:long-chain fatty acid transport protein
MYAFLRARFAGRARTFPAAQVFVALVLLLSCALPATVAHAGGFYLLDRGARALSMGGAFVASPDDPSALWYNPAGLIESKNQVVTDAVLPVLLADMRRKHADGTYSPRITARPTPIPIPTLAFSHTLGSDNLVLGGGIFAPMMFLMNWENSVLNPDTGQRDPPPTRYSLMELKGSVLANLSAGLAYKLGPLAIGFDVQVPIGYFRAKTALTACDAVICSFPEQKDFDAYASVATIPTYGISGVGGIILNLDAVRFGFSAMLPYTLRGSGKLKVKLPSNVLFEDAQVEGNGASISVKFPLILRAGGEMRPLPYLRMSGAFVWEQWSSQKSIDIDVKKTTIKNVTGLGDYDVGNIKLQRNMNDTWSLRGGFELTVPKKWMVVDIDIQLRGGLAYETGAFTNKTLSPITLDTNKWVLSGGLTVGLASWLRFDGVAGWIFMKNVDVDDGTITQPQAIRPKLETFPTTINNGQYAQEAFFVGGGFRALMGGASFREPTVKRDRRHKREDSVEGDSSDEPDAPKGGVPNILDEEEPPDVELGADKQDDEDDE